MVSQPQSVFEPPQLDPSWGYDLNLLSHAASHVALTGRSQPQALPQLEPPHDPALQLIQATQAAPQYDPKLLVDPYQQAPPVFDVPDLEDPMQDFNFFLDSVGLSCDWRQGVFNTVESNDVLANPSVRLNEQLQMSRSNINADAMSDQRFMGQPDEPPSFSRFGSRLPSLHPESSLEQDASVADDLSGSRGRPSWEVSDADRDSLVSKLDMFGDVLPKDFTTPSKYSLSRYLAGYINGFNEHMPFIHIPTLSVSLCSPELVLALAAIGAQYRFENRRGIEMFYAAKSVAIEQLRRREGSWSPQVPWPRRASLSRSSGGEHRGPTQSAHSSPYMPSSSPPVADPNIQLGTIQALLLLTAFATWERHRELLREAFAFQSTLARLVREDGLASLPAIAAPDNISWDEWIHVEGVKRTKFIIYCFFNLHSILWNVPPLILNAEVKLNLPDPKEIWKAAGPIQWRRLRSQNQAPQLGFPEALSRLFSKVPPTSAGHISSLGNYILIHAIIQQIFFARQVALSRPNTMGSSLRNEDLFSLEHALGAWKAGWKRTPESSLDPQNPYGPIAFTSTALLGLAYIRLHVDMGPLRRLDSRDSLQIAISMRDSPPLQRQPRLILALLHSAHALSIPVRLGIDFVSKTQTFFWSIQHSICSLECAFLLSKWLVVVSRSSQTSSSTVSNEQKLSEHEKKLLVWVRSLLDETEMAVPSRNHQSLQMTAMDDSGRNPASNLADLRPHQHQHQHQSVKVEAAPSWTEESDAATREFLDDPARIQQLSVAVVRAWAKTFKGNTSWAIVDLIGSALEIYADMLEQEGRVADEGGANAAVRVA
jgi:hypothetical protein